MKTSDILKASMEYATKIHGQDINNRNACANDFLAGANCRDAEVAHLKGLLSQAHELLKRKSDAYASRKVWLHDEINDVLES